MPTNAAESPDGKSIGKSNRNEIKAIPASIAEVNVISGHLRSSVTMHARYDNLVKNEFAQHYTRYTE